MSISKKILFIIICCCIFLNACSIISSVLPFSTDSDSTFSITFIDVGQGDSALVECDGRYMLIDGGDVSAGKTVYSKLEERGVNHLDILAISHFDLDHFGGISKAIDYASAIDVVICNSNDFLVDNDDLDYEQMSEEYLNSPSESDKEENTAAVLKEDHNSGKNRLNELEGKLVNYSKNGIKVPNVGDKFHLGSAEIEVVDIASKNTNDSLVLLVTYGDTRFLFTGDIQYEAQKRLYEKYMGDGDDIYKINVVKMPHHGSYEGSLYKFLETFVPDHAIISVGKGNRYGHPDEYTLNLLEKAKEKTGVNVYRTDQNGDITVKSDGKSLEVTTEK